MVRGICVTSDIREMCIMSANEEHNRFVQSLIAEKARLEGEKKALIEEFKVSIPTEWSPDDLKDKIRDLLAKAYARISQTIDNDDEPKLAFDAAKYVFSFGTGQTKITDANDPNKELNELLKNLRPAHKESDSDNSVKITDETSSTETES